VNLKNVLWFESCLVTSHLSGLVSRFDVPTFESHPVGHPGEPTTMQMGVTGSGTLLRAFRVRRHC
jgi:hypothetical protein